MPDNEYALIPVSAVLTGGAHCDRSWLTCPIPVADTASRALYQSGVTGRFHQWSAIRAIAGPFDGPDRVLFVPVTCLRSVFPGALGCAQCVTAETRCGCGYMEPVWLRSRPSGKAMSGLGGGPFSSPELGRLHLNWACQRGGLPRGYNGRFRIQPAGIPPRGRPASLIGAMVCGVVSGWPRSVANGRAAGSCSYRSAKHP